MSEKNYQDVKIEKIPQSRVKIVGEVTKEAFEKARKRALQQIVQSAELPGFRVGKAPEAMVVKQVGDLKILEKAAESIIDEVYGEIIEDHEIRAIGRPVISITKIAIDNPLGFSIETSIMPEVTIKDYKKLSKEAAGKIADASTEVEEKEIDTIIDDLRKHVAIESGNEKELPELNEEFLKKFGDFADVASFREKTKENILQHRKNEVNEKKRGAIADQLISSAEFDVPELFIESELDTMIGQFKYDVERNGLTFDGYLTSIKKTADDIRKEWRVNAERRARLELILKHIAREEKITPNEDDVKKEVEHIMTQHKTASRFNVRMYVENMMKNKMVLEFLES